MNSNGAMAESAKPMIDITTDITAVVDAAQMAMQELPDRPRLFQRAGRLCVISYSAPAPRWLKRPPQAPVMRDATPWHLRELASMAADWRKFDKRAKAWEPAIPPAWVIETVYGRPSWPFPPLEGIVCAPTLRPDGSLIDEPGYDAATGLYVNFNGTTFPPLRPRPSLDEARSAIGRLQEVFCDFPFAKAHHFSAALAAVLSLVVRYAIDGCIPLYAVRSTTRGAGKGLLIDAASLIATGRSAPRWAPTDQPEEERKRLLAIALAGDPLIHIDNVSGALGSDALDAALTTGELADRLLGQTAVVKAAWQAVVFASGNNLQFRGDMARRVVPIDLYPQMERPEERDDFTHPDLKAWVMKERPALVVAALTLMRAYFEAGCPRQGVKPLGSFEAWSHLVRQGLIWAGEADPCEGRREIEAESDPQYEALSTLLSAWHARYGSESRTVKAIKADLENHMVQEQGSGRWIVHPDWRDLYEALASLSKGGKDIDARAVGYALRGWQGRLVDGRRLITPGLEPHDKTTLWCVEVR
jgi:putative DNA primase/helicase